MDGLNGADGGLKPGVFVFRTLDDCDAHRRAAPRRAARPRSSAAGCSGLEAARGLLKLGLEVHVVHLDAAPDGGAARRRRRARSSQRTLRGDGRQRPSREGHHRDPRRGARDRARASRTAPRSTATWSSSRPGIRPNVGARRARRASRSSAASSSTTTCARRTTPTSSRSASARSTAAASTAWSAPLWEQAAGPRRSSHGRNADAAYHGSKLAHQAQGDGRRAGRRWASRSPPTSDDEVVTYTEPKRGIYKKLIVRDGRLVGAILLGDSSEAPTLLQCFDRGAPLPDDRADAAVPGSATPAQPISASTSCRTTRRSATATASPRASIVERVQAAGCRSARRSVRRDARGHGLRLLQARWSGDARRRGGGEVDRGPRRSTTTCRASRSPSRS